jgi:transcriptional regulator with XRE-family HTH domain
MPKPAYRLPRPYFRLGEYLGHLRSESKFTQREVSLALGYSSAQFISNFERGIAIPPLTKLRALLKLVGGDPDRAIDLLLACERELLREALTRKH